MKTKGPDLKFRFDFFFFFQNGKKMEWNGIPDVQLAFPASKMPTQFFFGIESNFYLKFFLLISVKNFFFKFYFDFFFNSNLKNFRYLVQLPQKPQRPQMPQKSPRPQRPHKPQRPQMPRGISLFLRRRLEFVVPIMKVGKCSGKFPKTS